MISSYALHGQTVEALALYQRLKEVGLQPDSVTFTTPTIKKSIGWTLSQVLAC